MPTPDNDKIKEKRGLVWSQSSKYTPAKTNNPMMKAIWVAMPEYLM